MRAALLALVALGLLAVWLRPPAPAPRPAESSVEGAPRSVRAESATPAAERSGSAAGDGPVRPRSLRGTRPDGGLSVDASGRFVPTLEARRLFDYVLSASGEAPPERLRSRIVDEIGRRLDGDAARAAVDLLDRYLAYRERARGLETVGDLDRRLAALVDLRRELLGPEAADAFFADEEAAVRTLLEARRVRDDPSLTDDERASRLAALEDALPPEERVVREAASLATRLRDEESAVRERGGTDADIDELRARLVGPDAAARLATLDRRRAEWSARVEAFRAARARVEDDASLTPAERSRAIATLLETSFTAPERMRVEALDRLTAQGTR